MSKYDGITRLLQGRSEPMVTIPWAVLDRAVGGLPASASNHQPWWYGDRAQVHAWRAAGYQVDRVQPGRAVTFRRSTLRIGTPPATPRSSTPAPPTSSRPDAPRRVALAALPPARTLAVIPCSKRKAGGGRQTTRHRADRSTGWSVALLDARQRVAGDAHVDERLLLPAWERYTGTFYLHAQDSLADAAGRDAPVLIISGGYGVLEASEPVGWYERRLHLADWPPGLLGREIAAYAHRRGLRDLVGFVAGTSPYAQLLRSTDWAGLGLERVLIVTADSAAGAAQVSVPRDLGLGFAAWYRSRLDTAPGTLRAEQLVTASRSPAPSPAPSLPSTAGPTAGVTSVPDNAAKADVQRAVDHLTDRSHAVPPGALDPRDPALRYPGLYAWWADEEALHLLRDSLGGDIAPLIYAGQAGATTSRQAITRAATLKSRILGQHLRAQTRGSTFALTLAAALREPLALTFAAPRKIDPPSRHTLALWMRAHLAVAVYPVADPTHLARLEDGVLDALDPPLNLDGRGSTAVRSRLSALRRAAGATASQASFDRPTHEPVDPPM